jgi:cytochrome c
MAGRVLTLLALLGAWACRCSGQEPGYRGSFGLGAPADSESVRAFVLHPAIPPDGRGLPEGSGTVGQGSRVFADKCARCHGASGKEGPYDELVGPGQPVYGPDAVRTIGNYWPYATTLYDYVKRAMPFDHPGSLTPTEVYGVTAWLLHENGILASDAVVDRETLPGIRMPARNRFVPDPRPLIP